VEQPLSIAPQLTSPSVSARPQRAFSVRRWQLLLVAGWLFQAGLRAWLGHSQTVPMANPDESAYLIAAQILGGGPAANFGHSTLYPAGYPLLLVPIFWFIQNPVTAYHAVLLVNALISALIMPLGYVAGRRLGLSRRFAYLAAMLTALLPAVLIYSDYALADAIFPVIVLAWLLTVHTWLTSASTRGRYLAAAGSGLLAGYAYAVHARGEVIVGCYLVLGLVLIWTRLVPRGTVAAAMAALAPVGVISWMLNRVLLRDMYPEGPRSMSSEVKARLSSEHGTVLVVEMAFGQIWRVMLDSWGVAAIGVVATLVVLIRRDTPIVTRLMAGLAVAVTAGIAITTPAALPADEAQPWASGRYLDCMICVFFLVGCTVLMRASKRMIAIYAACVVPPTIMLAFIVDAYSGPGSSVPTAGFGAAFNFGEPAVLTQNWTAANIFLATGVAIALLAVWVGISMLGHHRIAVAGLVAGLAAVSLLADIQITQNVTRPHDAAQSASVLGLMNVLKPGEPVAISTALGYQIWMPQDYEIWWTSPVFFNPQTSPPPAGISVVEVPWLAGQTASATWPTAPPGWQLAASNQSAGWAVWTAPSHRKQ
jgi:hypothetical protein